MRVPHQGLSCNVVVWWLSQGVAKPSLSSLNVYLYLDLICSFSEVLVANLVHPLYSHNFSQALINKYPDPSQHGFVYLPSFCSLQQNRFDNFVLNRQIFVVLPITLDFHTHVSREVESCPWFSDYRLDIRLCPPCTPTILPRYMKPSAPSNALPQASLVFHTWYS